MSDLVDFAPLPSLKKVMKHPNVAFPCRLVFGDCFGNRPRSFSLELGFIGGAGFAAGRS